MDHPHILFVCAKGCLRSRTAHAVRLALGRPRSFGGISPSARAPIRGSLVRAADLIVCMERGHAAQVRKRFADEVRETPVRTLNIPDEFDCMDPGLARQLRDATESSSPACGDSRSPVISTRSATRWSPSDR